MKRSIIVISSIFLFAVLVLSASCGDQAVTDPSVTSTQPSKSQDTQGTSGAIASTEAENPVRVITAEEAKAMMDTLESFIIVDVREQSEYDAGHIDGAVLVPVGSIEELAPRLLPDQDEVLLLYCRSGNRSARAADQLRDLGYTNIYDFGGINDWPYETVSAG